MSDFIKNMSDKIDNTAEKAGMKSTDSAGTNRLMMMLMMIVKKYVLLKY